MGLFTRDKTPPPPTDDKTELTKISSAASTPEPPPGSALLFGLKSLTGFFDGLRREGNAIRGRKLRDADDIFRYCPPFHAAVMRIARDIGRLPLTLVNADGDIVDDRHPIYKLMRRWQPGNAEAIAHLILDYLLYGCCFAEIKGDRSNREMSTEIHGVYRFSPIDVAYEWRKGTYLPTTIKLANGREFTIDDATGASDYFYMFNYAPQWTRDANIVSPIEPALEAAQAFIAMLEHCRRLAGNQYRPPGMISFERETYPSKERQGEIVGQLAAFYRKRSNEGLNMPLPVVNAKFHSFANTAAEDDFVNKLNTLARFIIAPLHFPAQYLYLPDSTTFRSQYETRRGYYDACILPLAEAFYKQLGDLLALNLSSTPKQGLDLRDFQFKIDINAIPALAAARAEAARTLSQTSGMSINEARAILGLPKVKDELADEILIHGGMIPMSEMKATGQEDENEGGDKPPPDKPGGE